MEDTILSAIEKSEPISQQHQVNADHFFLTFEELCIRSLFYLVRLSMGIFTARFWDEWGKMWGAKRPEMWKNEDWLLHHDKAPAHTSLVVREFLTKNNMTTVPRPAYSPDLDPCDFYVP